MLLIEVSLLTLLIIFCLFDQSALGNMREAKVLVEMLLFVRKHYSASKPHNADSYMVFFLSISI